ncbi:hypothetical protein J7337_007531 [Fusarium musae]|uniref:Major facilitator superfamily transporter n=1 Tax=Fusarium musae TaxID=1042133 RepID=A0A9P8DH88_9HYPO|nr:hypothetical protein J7337_007531 [Fusarium musae]KAG9501836.1 hypothetical protein J7337_007531 [Fusarium musae]
MDQSNNKALKPIKVDDKFVEHAPDVAHIDRGNIGNAKIEGMDKDLGLVGNQYNIANTIFFVPYIIFGAVTVAAGLVMPLLIIDTPERAKWLSDDEKRFVDLRLRLSGVRSNTEEGDKFSWKLLFKTMADWKVLLGITLAWANSVPNAAFKFTMPRIIKQLGFSTAQSQLLTMPPYVGGGIAAWLSGRFSDRLSWRMPFIVGPMSVLLVALAASCALLMEFCLWKSNKARAQLSEAEIHQKYSQEELDAMGERSPLYKYTL